MGARRIFNIAMGGIGVLAAASLSAPGTPTAIHLESGRASPTSALLRYTASTPGTELIWKYVIYYRVQGSGSAYSSALSPVNYAYINGLTSNTTYECYVQAVDELGVTSPVSATGTFTTDFAVSSRYDYPDPPTDIDNTRFTLPSGNVWTATNTSNASAAGTGTGNRTGCGLQYAIDNCARGDIIYTVPSTTGTYSGSRITLKAKSTGTDFIYILPSTYASLPPPGTRISPSDEANCSLFSGIGLDGPTQSDSMFVCENGASYYRLVGLVAKPATTIFHYYLFRFSNVFEDYDHIFVDRCRGAGIEGENGPLKGISIAGTHNAIIESYFEECVNRRGISPSTGDANAVWIPGGAGPFKIRNNFIEAGDENFFVGGTAMNDASRIPHDICVYWNDLHKKSSWLSAASDKINIKNLLELKSGIRAFIFGNRCGPIWAGQSDQTGFGLVLTPRNDAGTGGDEPWNKMDHVMALLNSWEGESGPHVMTKDVGNGSLTTEPITNVAILHNVFDMRRMDDGTITGAYRRQIQITGSAGSAGCTLTFDHNTWSGREVIGAGGFPYIGLGDFGGADRVGLFTFKNNIAETGQYAWKYEDTAFSPTVAYGGTTTAAHLSTSYVFTNNAFSYISGTGFSSSDFPAGNFFPADTAAVGFVNHSAQNFRLAIGSAYENAATDGTDLGCNIDWLDEALAPALSGVVA